MPPPVLTGLSVSRRLVPEASAGLARDRRLEIDTWIL